MIDSVAAKVRVEGDKRLGPPDGAVIQEAQVLSPPVRGR
jgi:hypothetical protein